MIFIRKKKKIKKPLTPQQKEQRFIKIGTRICIFLVFTFAIIFGVSEVVGEFQEESTASLSEELTKLISGVSTSEIIFDPINNDYFDGLMVKINESGFDIVDNNKPSFQKYTQNSIALTSDIELTNQELALLYSYVFMFDPDIYDVIFQQLTITTTDTGYTIDIVSTIDFETLFTSKIKNQYSSTTIDSMPKKIFLINSFSFENGEVKYMNVKYNNLTEEESLSISKLITSINDVDLNKYAVDLLLDFINTISTKTNSSISYVDNCLKLTKNV